MRLHEDERLFRQAVTATSEMLSIPEIFIEKDYWVTYVLRAVFQDSSIEYDQELIDGHLKVSLEGLIVILNNERELITGNLLMEEELPEDDLFPGGFSAQRFIEIAENGELWLVLK